MHTTSRWALAAMATLAASQAAAHCFMVYDRQQRLVYQSTEAPFDLSQTLSQGLATNYPGHHLVMAQSSASCPTVNARMTAPVMVAPSGAVVSGAERRRTRPPVPATSQGTGTTGDIIRLR